MSVSIVYQLFQRWPAYHKGLWALSSTNSGNLDFRYIVDVYSGGSNTFIDRWDPAPRPNDLYGIWNASVLNAKINPSKDVTELSSDFQAAPHSYVDYYLRLGEMTGAWRYTDFFFSAGSVGFTSTTEQHGFEVGDRINVSQTAGYLYSQYEGYAVVTAVPDAYSLVISKPYVNSGPVNGGIIRNYDGTPILVTGMTTSRRSYLFLSSFDRIELEDYNDANYVIPMTASTANVPLLTNMPDEYTMRLNARMMLPIMQFSGQVWGVKYNTFDSQGNVVGNYNVAVPNGALKGDRQMLYLSCGPWDITSGSTSMNVLSGSSDVLGSTVTSYEIFLYNSGATRISEIKTINLDRTCAETEYNLLWMDKKGHFVTTSFTAWADVEYQNKKKTYIYDGYGQYVGGQFVNDTASRGYDVYDSRQIKSVKVRTKPMTEEESLYFHEISDSPFVYWMYEPDVWLPIVVNDGVVPYQRYENDSFIQYELEFSMAYNENRNW